MSYRSCSDWQESHWRRRCRNSAWSFEVKLHHQVPFFGGRVIASMLSCFAPYALHIAHKRAVNDCRSLKYLFWGYFPPEKHKIVFKIIEEVNIIDAYSRNEKFLSPPPGIEKKCQPPHLAKTSFLEKLLSLPPGWKSIELSPGWQNRTNIFSQLVVDCSCAQYSQALSCYSDVTCSGLIPVIPKRSQAPSRVAHSFWWGPVLCSGGKLWVEVPRWA